MTSRTKSISSISSASEYERAWRKPTCAARKRLRRSIGERVKLMRAWMLGQAAGLPTGEALGEIAWPRIKEITPFKREENHDDEDNMDEVIPLEIDNVIDIENVDLDDDLINDNDI